MTNHYIEFKKQRDFGQLLSDTFGFIRNEFKPFFGAVLTISGPALVIFLIAMGFYVYTIGDLLTIDFSGNGSGVFQNLFTLLITLLVYVVAALLAYIFSASTALHYIKSYVENNGVVDVAEVKQNVYKTFWGYLGLGILKWLTLIIAFALCFLPVIYAMVPMFIVFCIYIFESKRNATDAYSYSFYLVNEDFWLSLGTIIVLGILMYILGLVFAVPTAIYSLVKAGISSGEFDPLNATSMVDPIYILLNVLATLFQFLLNIILVVGSALLYFHLNEKKNFTGTYERISNIGKIEE